MVATMESYGRLKTPTLAAVLSCFYMGLGHIYVGEVRKGITLIFLYTASLALISFLVGLITSPMLWVRGMVYAHESAEKMNRQTAEELAVDRHLTQEVELLPEMVLAEPLAE